MSEQPTEERGFLEVTGDLAFGDLMDTLVEVSEAEADSGGEAAAGPDAATADPGDAGSDGAAAAPAAGTAPEGDGGTAEPGTGEAGHEAGGSAPGEPGTADGGAEQPAAQPTADTVERNVPASAVIPRLGDLSRAVEENITNGYRTAAYEEAQRKYARYFEALQTHPRMLVGKEVPSMNKEGTETLQNTADAREWQEAVQAVLQQEIEQQAGQWMQDAGGFMETVHGSIDLFRNNPDLIPHTKEFDKELADAFAAMAKAYEVRIDGKLHGYSVPVQPIIDSLRQQIAGRRPPPPASQPAQSEAQSEPPQAAVKSKAATSSEAEDYSTLFGTIGLPNLRI